MSEDEDKAYPEQAAKLRGKKPVESPSTGSPPKKAATDASPEESTRTSQGGQADLEQGGVRSDTGGSRNKQTTPPSEASTEGTSTRTKKTPTGHKPRPSKEKRPRPSRKGLKAQATPSANSKGAEAAKPTRNSQQAKTKTDRRRAIQPKPGNQAPFKSSAGRNTTAEEGQPDYRIMVQSEEAQRELCERAERLAGEQKKDGIAAERETFVRFRLGPRELYGIPFRIAEEIVVDRHISRVPGTPGFISGVISINGELRSVLDLKSLFGIKTDASANAVETPIILVSANGMRLGILTDAIEGEDDYDPSKLAAPLASEGITNPRYIQGIHDGRVTILNLEALLEDPALIVK